MRYLQCESVSSVMGERPPDKQNDLFGHLTKEVVQRASAPENIFIAGEIFKPPEVPACERLKFFLCSSGGNRTSYNRPGSERAD